MRLQPVRLLIRLGKASGPLRCKAIYLFPPVWSLIGTSPTRTEKDTNLLHLVDILIVSLGRIYNLVRLPASWLDAIGSLLTSQTRRLDSGNCPQSVKAPCQASIQGTTAFILGELLFATLLGLVVCGCNFICGLLFTGEASYSSLLFGPVAGSIAGVVAFALTFRWLLHYGNPPTSVE
jgi:hypothetical protein